MEGRWKESERDPVWNSYCILTLSVVMHVGPRQIFHHTPLNVKKPPHEAFWLTKWREDDDRDIWSSIQSQWPVTAEFTVPLLLFLLFLCKKIKIKMLSLLDSPWAPPSAIFFTPTKRISSRHILATTSSPTASHLYFWHWSKNYAPATLFGSTVEFGLRKSTFRQNSMK